MLFDKGEETIEGFFFVFSHNIYFFLFSIVVTIIVGYFDNEYLYLMHLLSFLLFHYILQWKGKGGVRNQR